MLLAPSSFRHLLLELFLIILPNVPLQSLKLLSVMAVIRLDGEADNIIDILSRALLKAEDADLSNTLGDPLASVTWEQVIPVCVHG